MRSEQQQYALTLEMLLQVLQGHASSQCYQITSSALVELIPVVKGKAGRGTHCQVLLCLEHGTITRCTIRDQQDHLILEGQAALVSLW